MRTIILIFLLIVIGSIIILATYGTNKLLTKPFPIENDLMFINISGDYVKIDTITKFCNLSGKLYISTDTRSFWREGIRVNYAEYPLRTDEINAVMEILINYRR